MEFSWFGTSEFRLLERFTNVEKFSFEDSDLNCGSK